MVIMRWVVAPVAGFLLGFLDFVWIKYVPFPLGGLGNSLAVWAVAAFLLAFAARWRPVPAALGGVVCLVVAVPSYYLAASLIQHDDWSNLTNATSLLWMGFGVVAGVVFGAGGSLARRPGALRLPALALPAAVLFAEAVIELRRLGDPSYHGQVPYAVVLIVLALLTTALTARSWRAALLALAWSIPLTAAGWLLLTLTGFR